VSGAMGSMGLVAGAGWGALGSRQCQMGDNAQHAKTESALALRVALAPLVATADIAVNARVIAAAIRAAVAAGAQVLLTPECGLCGYPSAARAGLDDVNRCALAEAEDALLMQAERAGLVLVLGSAECVSAECGPAGWTNDAVIGGAVSATRYHKRHLTPGDRDHFQSGTRSVVIAHAGWRLGLAICYDLRAAPVMAALAQADADVFLVIAHMAGVDPEPGVKATLIPQLCAVRAAEWATPLAFCNTAAPDAWCASGAWDARGMALPSTSHGALFMVDLPARSSHPDWYQRVREDHLAQWPA